MKALIIEDDEIIARTLQNKIKQVDSSIDIIDVLPSLKVARKWFQAHPEPDILFMDIQLGDGVSFDLLEQFSLGCPIVFTTAYDEYAIRAFKVNGVDYLLKPVDEAELKRAIDKCISIIENKRHTTADITELVRSLGVGKSQFPRYKERFLVHSRNQWMPVQVKEIAFFTKDVLNYLYLFNGERYLVDEDTLDDVEEILNPDQFYRANRQFVINIDAIQSVKAIENSKILVRLKEPNQKFEIDISREKAPAFKKWMNR